MKTVKIAILGLVLSTIVLYISAYHNEGGDTSAVTMYFVVFLIPVIILAFLNAIYLFLVGKFINGVLKIICGLIPILIFTILSFQKKMVLPYFDANVSFLALISAIGLGITSIVWAFSNLKKKAA